MKAGYHPDVQADVNRVLRRYDEVSDRLADEFWEELQLFIQKAAEHPTRFHPSVRDLRRVNLKRFPYHFLFRVLPDRIRITAVRHHRQSPDFGIQRR
jgi:plasmid stabilization system protein ParE